jgi:cell division control protein 6
VDKTEQLIKALAKQQQFVLHACYTLLLRDSHKITTGQAYEVYKTTCTHESLSPLTQRRFSDILSSLDLYGLINARVISRGRYGSTREISSALPREIVKNFLKGDWSTQTHEGFY